MSPASRSSSPLGYVVLSLIWIVVAAGVWLATRTPSPQPLEIVPLPSPAPTNTVAPTSTPSPIRVDVAGAVRSPGVYKLPPNSIVAEAIAAAGGPSDDADLDRINKATALQDGVQVYVPRKTDDAPTPELLSLPPAAASAAGSSVTEAGLPININTASAEQLDSLPGIGPVLAERIIAGRPYASVEEILRVSGIGDALLGKLRGAIAVE